jgi:hypothetical protein
MIIQTLTASLVEWVEQNGTFFGGLITAIFGAAWWVIKEKIGGSRTGREARFLHRYEAVKAYEIAIYRVVSEVEDYENNPLNHNEDSPGEADKDFPRLESESALATVSMIATQEVLDAAEKVQKSVKERWSSGSEETVKKLDLARKKYRDKSRKMLREK